MMVTMGAMRMMQMTIHDIIDMIAMWYGFMSTRGTVNMRVIMRTA